MPLADRIQVADHVGKNAPCWDRTSLKANYEFAASPIGQRRL